MRAVAEFAERAHHDRHGLAVGRGLQHLHQARHCALAADLCQGVHGALADPPVAVARCRDEGLDRALVLGLVEDLDGRAPDVLVLVAHQLQYRVDHLRATDLAERIGGAAAHPPVAVLERLEQVLDGFGVADLVQHFDGGTARVLVLVLQHLDQVADGFRVVGLDDHIDGPVENVDLRIPQQRGHALDIDGSVHALQRRQRGPTDQLVGIFQQSLQRGLHLGRVKARQGVDDVHARDGVLALHAADQFGKGLRVGDLADDAEQCRLLVGLLRIRRGQQLAHRET